MCAEGVRGVGKKLTRREACVVLGALGAGTLGLVGCSTDSDPTSRTGFASDTEVKSYPVHLKLYVDSYLQWQMFTNGQQTRLDSHIERYRTQKDRSEVSFEVVYVDLTELLAMAREGFSDGDGLLALRDTVYEGCASGAVDAGVAALSVRSLSYHYHDNMCLVRAAESDAELPDAITLTGEDAPDGKFNRLQQLPNFDGTIALADPETVLEGRLANDVLAGEEFYLDGSASGKGGLVGGSYAADIADKIAIYPSQDAAMAAVMAGECQLGFALNTSLAARYPEVEKIYQPPHGGLVFYDGAALTCSAEPGVMRDFFTFETALSD